MKKELENFENEGGLIHKGRENMISVNAPRVIPDREKNIPYSPEKPNLHEVYGKGRKNVSSKNR